MAQQNLDRQLRTGIRAAQQGDAERARPLLEGVLRVDRNNEQAWIWMAAIVKTVKERRLCLEKVLQVNPGNRPARAALNSLVGVIGGGGEQIDYQAISNAAAKPIPAGTSRSSGGTTGRNAAAAPRSGGGGSNSRVILGGVAVVMVIGLLLSFIVPRLTAPDPTPIPSPTAIAESTEDVTPGPSLTPSRVPTSAGGIVTLAPGTPLPTNTPTITPTPTQTLTPSPTLPPLTDYTLYFLGALEIQEGASLYQSGTDGSGQQRLVNDILFADLTMDRTRLAYVRSTSRNADTGEESGVFVQQAFIGDLSNPDGGYQVSRLLGGNVFNLTISPDGSQMIFSSSEDGDGELILVNLQTGVAQKLTDNTANDSDPSWSPDGSNIIFASDRDSAGQNDIFSLNMRDGVITRLVDTPGDSRNPRWSPDGSQIVFSTARGSASNISVMSADGSRTRQLSTAPRGAQVLSPTWTPDGRYVAFVTQYEAEADRITFITPTGDHEQTVTLEGLTVSQVIVR